MKINVYPCKAQFYCINWGLWGVKTIEACFLGGFATLSRKQNKYADRKFDNK